MGGGRLLRAVGRVVGFGIGGGIQQALPSAPAAGRPRSPCLVSFPSSPSVSSLASSRSSSASEEDGWETLGSDDVRSSGPRFDERVVFGTAPSKIEVAEAVATIQQIFVPATFSQVIEDRSAKVSGVVRGKSSPASASTNNNSGVGTISDIIDPGLQVCAVKSFESQGVIEAFRSLQINPSVQRMVVSLSTDKAVWDAVMKNDAVKELKRSLLTVERCNIDADDATDLVGKILSWILQSTKIKLLELFERVWKVVNEVFLSLEMRKKVDEFEDSVRSSLVLSVLVFLVIALFRVYRSQ